MFSIYVHIPFCIKKCDYCDFYSVPSSGGSIPVGKYSDALTRHIADSQRLGDFADKKVGSIYFGGGTPSLMPADFFAETLNLLHANFDIERDAEISCEVNPKTSDASWFRAVKNEGVNRITVGVQSFDDALLRMLGRAHSAEDAMRCIAEAQDAGFDNTGLDLIYAMPGEGIDVLENDLRTAMMFQPRHVSAYALTIEDDTPMSERIARGELAIPSDDMAVKQMRLVSRMLGRLGLQRYEISNFAKAGFESRHNLNYWRYGEYLGFGPGAASFLIGREEGFFARRWKTRSDVVAFLEGRFDPSEDESIDEHSSMFEFCFMGLRAAEGLDPVRFSELFGKDLMSIYRVVIDKLVAESLALVKDGRVSLTDRGFELSNQVFERFILD